MQKKALVIEEYNNVSNKVQNQIKESNRNNDKNLYRRKDKADRATIENCLDPKTIQRLEKLINKGDLEHYEGCLSTGKEANVYYGKGFDKKHLAIKIYKTSILVFKDRERYISGEFRFRHGYCKSNPRKMVAIWAEKEVRNLKRIQLSGIKAPTPYLLKSNLIIMELIGEGSQPAPRLKDADVDDYNRVYLEVVFIMNIMFKKCKLVHSDLSEYNLLYLNKEIYVIDVAQAVEDDHPNALLFLKRDCININNFFYKYGVEVITNRQLFNIIAVMVEKKDIDINDITEMVTKARLINKQRLKENTQYFILENHSFQNFDFYRTMNDLDELKIQGNDDIRNTLSQLCGIVESKSSYVDAESVPIDRNYIGKKKVENNNNEDNEDIDNIGEDNCKTKEVRLGINDYLILDNKEKILNENTDITVKEDSDINTKLKEMDNKENEMNNNILKTIQEETKLKEIQEEEDKEDEEDEDEEDDEEEEEDDDISLDSLDVINVVEGENPVKLYFDEDGKIIDKETALKIKLEKEKDENYVKNKKEKKPHDWNPFEGLSKQERKKKVKEDNKEKRANKKLSKYEKQKKIQKTSGKKK